MVYESALTESLRAAAVAGLGMAWLPPHFVPDDLDAGRLVHAGSARHEVRLGVNSMPTRPAWGSGRPESRSMNS